MHKETNVRHENRNKTKTQSQEENGRRAGGSTMEKGGGTMADGRHSTRKWAPHVLCLAPVYHIGSEIEKRKKQKKNAHKLAPPLPPQRTSAPTSPSRNPLLPTTQQKKKKKKLAIKTSSGASHLLMGGGDCSKALKTARPSGRVSWRGPVWRMDAPPSGEGRVAALANGYYVEVKDLRRLL